VAASVIREDILIGKIVEFFNSPTRSDLDIGAHHPRILMNRSLQQFLVTIPILGSMLLAIWRLFKDPNFGPIGERIAGRLSWWRPQMIVQIGANDGIRFDPISALIKHRRRWRVLFVEPIPSVFERLVRNFGRSHKFMFECSAVGATCGSSSFYYLAEDAQQNARVWHEWFGLVGSLDRSHVVRNLGSEAARLDKFIVETRVPVVTLEALLDKWKIESVDALVVDAEGHDWKIVRQALEIELKPDVILFEHVNLSDTERQDACRMLDSEYSVEDVGIDYLCVKKRDRSKGRRIA
jgi:FkbM family methyltransferase